MLYSRPELANQNIANVTRSFNSEGLHIEHRPAFSNIDSRCHLGIGVKFRNTHVRSGSYVSGCVLLSDLYMPRRSLVLSQDFITFTAGALQYPDIGYQVTAYWVQGSDLDFYPFLHIGCQSFFLHEWTKELQVAIAKDEGEEDCLPRVAQAVDLAEQFFATRKSGELPKGVLSHFEKLSTKARIKEVPFHPFGNGEKYLDEHYRSPDEI